VSPGAQATQAGVGGAAGAASSADVTAPADAHQVQALLVDIFAMTGQKVEISDPLVAAALIHSALLRRAGQDAARAIEQAAQSARHDLAGSHLHQAGQLSPGRIMALVLLCLLAGALGAGIVLAAQRWLG
jgi:hypothetical protein